MRCVCLFLIGLGMPVWAALEVPALFSDHAVLQAGAKVPVWGWADEGAEVKVSFAGQELVGKAGAGGKWRVVLVDLKASSEGRDLMIASGVESLVVKDVLVGEVWLGSGQSNMAMSVSRARDYEKEKAASDLPTVRMFTEGSSGAVSPQERCKGQWVVCGPETVGRFSATLFFFGREIGWEMKSPMGLINSSVGGTPIEAWIGKEAQMGDAGLKGFFEQRAKDDAAFDAVAAKAGYEKQLAVWTEKAKAAKASGKPVPRRPQDPVALREKKGDLGGLFNGKIAPLIPYAIRGVVWYQGEANSNGFKAGFYDEHLKLLASEWRRLWGYEFPMAWAQLPNFEANREDGWMRVREGMFKAVKVVPGAGMAVTLDAGEAQDIHPKDKQTVGHRLARWALAKVYGKGGASSGPLMVKHEVRGVEVVVAFEHVDGGLVLKEGGGASGFEVAGADKVWHAAKAQVEGEKLVISSDAVKEPVAVRYAWAEMAAVTLWNGEDLPASPFRTVDWE
jgi:sialate O-acetylesterase